MSMDRIASYSTFRASQTRECSEIFQLILFLGPFKSPLRCSSNDNYQIVHSANLQVSILSFCARHFAKGYNSQLPLEMPIQRRRPLCSRLIYKYSLEAFVLILSLKTTTWDFRWKCTSKDNHQFVRQSTLQVVIGVKWQNYRDKLTSSRSSSWRKYTHPRPTKKK
ncbi:hypothetical protein P3S67_002949 [Capsicum chacoense]